MAVGFWLSWRRLTFWINEKSELEVRSGIFFHRSRLLRISRLQAVDVTRPLLARLTGFAALKVEVAGTGDSRVLLAYLTETEAHSLRETILTLAGDRTDEPDRESDNQESGYPQWRVPNSRLIASLALTSSTYFLIIGAIVSIVFAIIEPGFSSGSVTLIIAVGSSLLPVIAGITQMFNFVLTRTNRGISISHGLFTTSSYSVSPTRLQAISLSQPITWRPFRWYRITINVAGINQSQQNSGPKTLIPVIHEDHIPQLLDSLVPEWNIDFEPNWHLAPRSARWRHPLQARKLGTAITPSLFVTKSGALTRRFNVAPHARLQSVRITQGPWQRKLGIASVHGDSVPGPVRLSGVALSESEAVALALEELDSMAASHSQASSEKW